MKKSIISMLLLAAFVSPAAAKSRAKARTSGPVPYAQNSAIDHSKDGAFDAGNAAVSPSADASFVLGQSAPAASPIAGKTHYYSYELNGQTVYGRYARADMNGPYQGHDNPSFDGVEKNKYRNMRAYNESEPLPPNNGSK